MEKFSSLGRKEAFCSLYRRETVFITVDGMFIKEEENEAFLECFSDCLSADCFPLGQCFGHDYVGSGIRETAEMYTLEDEYNDYLKLTEPVMERYYDDVGAYRWVPGLPDEQSISQYQALCIGMKALCDQYQQKPADFIHYYPRFSYETSDPDNPMWKILWIRYDTNDASISYNVGVHAYTGNVIGVSKRMSVG